MATAPNHAPNVIKFVQTLLVDDEQSGSVTPALINEKIDLVLAMNRKWEEGLDRQAVTDELVRRFSLWVGKDTTLQDNTGHEQWLNAARKQDWRYWQRYQEWMEQRLSAASTDALDRATDHILGLLEDPTREGTWDRRGLVVGHVQSGKTGNYTGLICKAADAGYKIIIVLAGLHNNLRSQTQMRLDEGFLGYETKPTPDDLKLIGVGEIDSDPSIRPNYATNRSNSGDFNAAAAKNLGVSPEQRPWLFVVKKNKTVLERLNRWVRNHVANTHDPETGRKIVTNLPLLLIDDEADHASVDTGAQLFDEDGNADEEHQPKAINSLIRRLLHSFTKSAYVGYTATPFANIFIHERGKTREEGPDLFPASFIINLGAPSNYIGPAKIFGAAHVDEEGLPLVEAVDDYCESETDGWIPAKHKNGHVPLYKGENKLPPSLEKAINSFFLTCAVRRLRGQQDEHASMLVHVTRYTAVQQSVAKQIDDYVSRARQRLLRNIDTETLLLSLRHLWEHDYRPTSERIRARYPDDTVPVQETWEQVLEVLTEAVVDIEVRMINGTAKDALDYADNGKGLKVIAVGGDKLARGLTLEGLTTSYFLRASKMYDTLMQMGRWFGYRPGYLDLCRLYTTSELIEWFKHISAAAEELREEFDLMAASGGTPRDYGLKVQSHSTLLVTSRLKMRTARSLMLSFSGDLLETVAFHSEKAILEANLKAGRDLLCRLGAGEPDPVRTRSGSRQEWKGQLWRGVPADEVVAFLQAYTTHPSATRVIAPLLAQFIEGMAQAGELTEWTVALIGGGVRKPYTICEGIEINPMKRTAEKVASNRYSIKRLLSPRDESIDLDEAQWLAALELTRKMWKNDPARMQESSEPETPNGPSIRAVTGFGAVGVPAHPERGLLLLTLIDPEESKLEPGSPPILAFAMSFPGSNSGPKIEYKVDNVYWEQMYGAAD